jgi:purine-nucleoside phosphorylase
MQTVVLPVQVMRCLGVRLVVVTNAAGGLKESYNVGDVAIIRDHIALPLLCGKNPLVGINDDELGPRFPPTSNLYDVTLQNIVLDVAKQMNFDQFLHTNGTYAFVSGPQYESKSECAMLRMLGADAVGMSTVPEILAAHHSGMAVLCLSLITNKVVYYDEEEGEKKVEHANHAEVLTAVKGRGEQMVKLVGEVVKKCGEVYLPTLKELDPICLETEGRVRGEVISGGSSGEKKTMLCPYHLVKGILSAPAHCMVLGGSILAAGVVLGMKMSKR